MALSFEFQQFYESWMHMANEYGTGELREWFDNFFALFVVCNRLYAEATFTLVRRGGIPCIKRDFNHPVAIKRIFSDRFAATHYLQQYLKSTDIINYLESDNATATAVDTVMDSLKISNFILSSIR